MAWQVRILTRDLSSVPADLVYPSRIQVVADSEWDDDDPPPIKVYGLTPGQPVSMEDIRAGQYQPGQRVEIAVKHGDYLQHDAVVEVVALARDYDYDLTIKVWD